MPSQISPVADLRAALHALAESVDRARFSFPAVAQPHRTEQRADLGWALREYLIPRLGDLDSPLVAVILGSTGSGKSTLLNSLAGRSISDVGAVRPTTTAPVVWAHRSQANRYADGFLTGYGSGGGGVRRLQIVSDDGPLTEGLTVIDAPDFDSVVEQHREVADELLAVADVCIFVTSAQRYADAVPWGYLQRARERGVPVLFVVNRLGVDGEAIADDYRRRLVEEGFPVAGRFFLIVEQAVQGGRLPPAAVAEVRDVLEDLTDPMVHRAVLRHAVHGALDDAVRRARRLADTVEAETAEIEALRRAAVDAYEAQIREVQGAVADGTLVRGEVVDRWQSFLGTGELLKVVSEGMSAVARWSRRVLGGKPRAASVERDAKSEIAALLERRADLAATTAASAWDLDPAGARLLRAEGLSLWRHDPATAERARVEVEQWLGSLSKLIRDQGDAKRKTALAASYGVNAVAVVLLLGVFVHTGGLTGAEMGVAAGAAAAQQKLLEHIFGGAAARSLIETARDQLNDVAGHVLLADLARFTDRLAPYEDVAGDLGDELRTRARQVEKEGARWHEA